MGCHTLHAYNNNIPHTDSRILVASCRLIHCTETLNDFHRYVSVIRILGTETATEFTATAMATAYGNGYGTLEIRHHTTKTAKIKKVLLRRTYKHVEIMATCCKSNSTFLIFAVLVV